MTAKEWDALLTRLVDLVDRRKADLVSLAAAHGGLTTANPTQDRQVTRGWSKGEMVRAILEGEYAHMIERSE